MVDWGASLDMLLRPGIEGRGALAGKGAGDRPRREKSPGELEDEVEEFQWTVVNGKMGGFWSEVVRGAHHGYLT